MNSTNFQCQEHAKQARNIFTHLAIVLMIVGTFSNILSLIVFLRSKMRIHSTFIYLAILSVLDLFVIYFGLLRDYLVFKFDLHINDFFLCKLHVFSFYFFLHMSSWLMVSVNVDRLIVVSFIKASKLWCTPRKALFISTGVTIIMFISNSHFIYYAKTANLSDKHTLADKDQEEPINPYVYRKCAINRHDVYYYYFIRNIYPIIDASLQVFIPFAIMIFCNINIIYRVILSKKRLDSRCKNHLKKAKGMCIMIVTLSLLFLTFESPILIFICLTEAKLIDVDSPCTEIFWIIMNTMMYFNHISNFFMYTMTSTKFRQELKCLLRIQQLPNKLTLQSNYTLNRKNVYKSNISTAKNRQKGTSNPSLN
jgi:hypothetical protein